jgi:hypothetical protein
MMEIQEAKCPICLEVLSEADNATHVDHDHRTGEVYALLCRTCNLGIGHLQHDIELLERALEYVRHTHHQSTVRVDSHP